MAPGHFYDFSESRLFWGSISKMVAVKNIKLDKWPSTILEEPHFFYFPSLSRLSLDSKAIKKVMAVNSKTYTNLA